MSFVGVYLWMIGMVVIPFGIHFLVRRPPLDHFFPGVIFLLQAKSESFSISKVKNLLLLILRVLIILLFLLAIWRPQIQSSTLNSLGKRKGSFVLILDNSLSMSYQGKGEKSLFEKGKEKARKIFSTFHETSKKAILSTSNPSGNIFFYSPSFVSTVLKESKISYGKQGLALALEKASILLQKEEAKTREIYILSDLDQNSLHKITNEKLEKIVENGIKVFFIPIHSSKGKNSFFKKVSPSASIVPHNTLVTISFEVQGVFTKKTILFYIEGERKGGLILSPSSSGNVSGKFQWTFLSRGVHRCSLKIQEKDVLEKDNQYYFSIQVLPPQKILLVHPMLTRKYSALYYMERALDPSLGKGRRRFQIQSLEIHHISSANLHSFDIIFLVACEKIKGLAEKKITDFIKNGGALFIFPPIKFSKKSPYYSFSSNKIKASSKPLYWIGEDSKENKVIDFFENGKNGDLRAPKFFRFLDLSNLSYSYWKTIFSYNTGEPALLYRSFQKGSIFLFTSLPDQGEDNQGRILEKWKWSTLAMEPVFPILLHELIKQVYQYEKLSFFEVGDPIRFFLKEKMENVKIILPDFKTKALKIQKGWVDFRETWMAGIYKIKGEKGYQKGIEVNVSLLESHLEYTSKAPFLKKFSRNGVFYMEKLKQLNKKVGNSAYFHEITGWILGFLILLMILENMIAHTENFSFTKWKILVLQKIKLIK